MHDSAKIKKDQQQKTHVHTMYDHTKGGVDVVDFLSTNHLTKIKSKRWPVNVLPFVLDTCSSNVKYILRDNNIQFTNLKFTYTLGKLLVLPCIQRWFEKSNSTQIGLVNRMWCILRIQEVARRPQQTQNLAKFA